MDYTIIVQKNENGWYIGQLLGIRKDRPQLDFAAISNAISDVYPNCRKNFIKSLTNPNAYRNLN